MKYLFRLAFVALPCVLPLAAWAQNGVVAQDQNAHAFATRPPANTKAFSTTPPANTNAFGHSVSADTNALGTKGPGRTTAFGHNGVSTTAGGSTAIGTTNARRAANSFGTGTDQGSSPVGGHDQNHKGGG